MTGMQFATYNDSNSPNSYEDWFVRFSLIDGASEVDFNAYPRNSSDYASLQDEWVVTDESTLMLDTSGTLVTFANFITGAYSNYQIK